MKLTEKDAVCCVGLSGKESPAVRRAAQDLCRDLESICGCRVELVDEAENVPCTIQIGTLGVSAVMQCAVQDGTLDIEPLYEDSLRKEGFVLQEHGGTLYIAGTDRRGTIYGIYDFTESQGVSPWYYFADVPIKHKGIIELADGFYKSDYPSVEYRGIFLNDEEELNAWSQKHTTDGTIGPKTYRHIFELLLRLKANTIWPAMHVNYFNENPENGRLADEMGIVVGTSHCDMLLRSNQNEWHPWLAKKGYRDVAYDYSIPGHNREILREYWRESVEQNQDYEVCYTVGMRGIHDTGFVTAAIDCDESLNEAQKRQARVRLLEQVITDQRQILKEVLGAERGTAAMQTFVPYKEVLPLYDSGLKLPDDVTIIWVNDNHGYIRRYPSATERQRPGGHGLYYHNSYWAPPPMSYLFTGGIPLAHTGNELRKAYESGIRKLWVLNVGALKPLELEIDYFLHCGWDVGKPDALTRDTNRFVATWCNRNFSGSHGAKLAPLYNLYAQTTNLRKVEHMDNDVFSQTAWGNEAGRRIRRFETMFEGVNAIYEKLPGEEKDAFFEMVLFKMYAAYFTSLEYYAADRSCLHYDRGNMPATDAWVNASRHAAGWQRWMIRYYNKAIADGKWDQIMTPEKFPPPPTALYPAGRPALMIGEPGLTLFVPGGTPGKESAIRLIFDPFGPRVKTLELGNTGKGPVHWKASISGTNNWLKLSQTEGCVEVETILSIECREADLGDLDREAVLEISGEPGGQTFRIEILAPAAPTLPAGAAGFVESEGCVSIPAVSFTSHVEWGSAGWRRIPCMGRGAGDAMMVRDPALLSSAPSGDCGIEARPYLEYPFITHTAGTYCLEVYRFLTLDATGRIRLAVSLDSMPPVTIESQITDEWRGDWKNCVMNDGEKLRIWLPSVSAGAHTLRVYMIDNYVTFSKLVVYTTAAARQTKSHLGPPYSVWKGPTPCPDSGEKTDSAPCYPVWEAADMDALLRRLYQYDEAMIPLLPIVYAAKDFWQKDILYMKNEQYEQTVLGCPRYTETCKLQPGGVVSAFGQGVFQETDSILALEAEYALENSRWAYITPSLDGRELTWTHLQAETDGGTGFAMHVDARGMRWDDPAQAPGLHYRIQISHPGTYHIWLLLRFFDEDSDSCYFALDGRVQQLEIQPSHGNLFTYSTTQVYFWSLVTDLVLPAGEHEFTILARKSALRIDRIYATTGEERPPMDAKWQVSLRQLPLH